MRTKIVQMQEASRALFAAGQSQPNFSFWFGTLFAGDRGSCCDEAAVAFSDNEQLVAVASISPNGEADSGEPTIVGLYTLPQFRGKGFGKAAMEAAIRRCLERGFQRIRIDALTKGALAVIANLPAELRDKLGPAIGQQAYKAYRDVLESDRWQRLANVGARAQRLLFASTGTKDPKASDVLYIGALAAPNTINTMPEETLLAFGQHGSVAKTLPIDGGDCEQVMTAFGKAGVDVAKLAADLQSDGAKDFVKSWKDLLDSIESKSKALK